MSKKALPEGAVESLDDFEARLKEAYRKNQDLQVIYCHPATDEPMAIYRVPQGSPYLKEPHCVRFRGIQSNDERTVDLMIIRSLLENHPVFTNYFLALGYERRKEARQRDLKAKHNSLP